MIYRLGRLKIFNFRCFERLLQFFNSRDHVKKMPIWVWPVFFFHRLSSISSITCKLSHPNPWPHYKFTSLAEHIGAMIHVNSGAVQTPNWLPQTRRRSPILATYWSLVHGFPFIDPSSSLIHSVASYSYNSYDNESTLKPIKGTTVPFVDVWNLSDQGRIFLGLDAVPPAIVQKMQYITLTILTHSPTFIFTYPKDVLC